ncbi:dimethylarginine dimethylaminohydrolase family protein [Rhizomicrobium electricum]|uniref:Arginine deiminase-related protein n=1 Tax=Rhizomicrobium electricum TaxID=480070 RepID=A0ABN1EFC0_9PROT|nr:arginine deiminase-related protein [Rhizomicrobium electricum]NIJ48601.1 N-dimethylarginine dimethylaminohydrolase [Rhizomicrobium electricum]
MAFKPKLLMVDPSHFEVSYVINPWMKPGAWHEDPAGHLRQAQACSAALHQALTEAGAEVVMVPGAPGLPDMVFPANAAVVLDGRAIVARFACDERRGEEALFLNAFRSFEARGLLDTVVQYPEGIFQEGAGDCLWDDTRQQFWAGYGQRSAKASLQVTEDFFNVPVVPLELVSPRFYHLDTCFLVLSGGEILYYPPAFSAEGRAVIEGLAGKENVLEASDEDAAAFSVNAVNFGKEIVMARPPAKLKARLEERGYHVRSVDLDPFILSGGGAYCMTLRLNRFSAVKAAAEKAAAE